MINELAQRNMPTHSEVLTSLQAYRHNLAGGARHVWLVVTDDHNGWMLVDDQRELEGAYARCTVGKADLNVKLHDDATRMLGQVRRHIEAP